VRKFEAQSIVLEVVSSFEEAKQRREAGEMCGKEQLPAFKPSIYVYESGVIKNIHEINVYVGSGVSSVLLQIWLDSFLYLPHNSH
jgi:hypothetical protein